MFDFGSHLKTLRALHKVTQKQVAQATKITERNYQLYEANKQKPGYDYLISLADFFDISLDYLVGRNDDPHRY